MSPTGETPKRLPVLLRRAWYGLNQAFRQRIAHLDITPDQFTILRWLSEGDPLGLTQSTISELMGSDPNTITATLKRMERSGLVTRRPHETDRRAHRVQIQPNGMQIFEKARAAAVELQRGIMTALPEGDRAEFLRQLEIVADACARASDEGPSAGS